MQKQRKEDILLNKETIIQTLLLMKDKSSIIFIKFTDFPANGPVELRRCSLITNEEGMSSYLCRRISAHLEACHRRNDEPPCVSKD